MFKCVLVSLLEIKSFVSLKNESLLFFTKLHFTFQGGGGSQVLQNFEGFAHKGGGGGVLTDLEF